MRKAMKITRPTYPVSRMRIQIAVVGRRHFLIQPGASTTLGASGPTSQKDWYPHPKSGLRPIS